MSQSLARISTWNQRVLLSYLREGLEGKHSGTFFASKRREQAGELTKLTLCTDSLSDLLYYSRDVTPHIYDKVSGGLATLLEEFIPDNSKVKGEKEEKELLVLKRLLNLVEEYKITTTASAVWQLQQNDAYRESEVQGFKVKEAIIGAASSLSDDTHLVYWEREFWQEKDPFYKTLNFKAFSRLDIKGGARLARGLIGAWGEGKFEQDNAASFLISDYLSYVQSHKPKEYQQIASDLKGHWETLLRENQMVAIWTMMSNLTHLSHLLSEGPFPGEDYIMGPEHTPKGKRDYLAHCAKKEKAPSQGELLFF